MTEKFKHQRQQTQNQCGIASIAMATGLSYEYVLNIGKLSGNYTEAGGTHSSSLLGALDVSYRSLYDHGRQIGHGLWEKMLWGRRAVLSVDSLNREGGKHLIYWHYDRLFDPQKGNKGKRHFTELKECSIERADLICECPECREVKPRWKIKPL